MDFQNEFPRTFQIDFQFDFPVLFLIYDFQFEFPAPFQIYEFYEVPALIVEH